MASPVEQFVVKTVIPLGSVGGTEPGLTNAAVFMILAVALIIGGLLWATRRKALAPGPSQAGAEMLHELIPGTLQDASGRKGVTFFPLVFLLFIFLTLNLLGMIPGGFTVTSQIVVTYGLAVLMIGTVIGCGFLRHSLHDLGLFVPTGVPRWLLPVLMVIEITSFLSRPLSLGLRPFAHVPGKHIALKVFGGFVVVLGTAGAGYALLASLPLAMAVASTGFAFLVVLHRASVFTVLTCIHPNDLLHP